MLDIGPLGLGARQGACFIIEEVAQDLLVHEDIELAVAHSGEAWITVQFLAQGHAQSTEAAIGPYPLNDFFLHYVVRHGFSPAKIAFLAEAAWTDASRGDWPDHVSKTDRRIFTRQDILHWLGEFARRFYGTSQFKRSAIPNGPKLTSAGALSPRGDWRMPSDSAAKVWRQAVEALRTELS